PRRAARGVAPRLRATRRAHRDRGAGRPPTLAVGVHFHVEGPRTMTGWRQAATSGLSNAAGMELITTTDELASACQRLSRHPFVTVDTEFLRETTYYPLLCVAQMAS